MNDRTELQELQIRPKGKEGDVYGFHAEPGGAAQNFG